ncbi:MULTISPECIES: efflux RND transporter permease subunit [Hydrocarboniphaga]|jgi:HME family heavy-metal exporter|uniref:Acriflavin resistance protein n=1 Tax=Hydrocarboniphaga effusa AP103 TaxID=1172194 RepID=I7ZD09_9GAMM|nr:MULTISPECIES: efflux RND transporter permease subunit [Hydrocarboniphaga]EIT69779.1 hypothetical protein WQQ_33610 [Hydrocarboniphaga effusa AP103]MDZ4078839.1 efflux RND transporter permease subunit [Hydrocarboniphaga sp.]
MIAALVEWSLRQRGLVLGLAVVLLVLGVTRLAQVPVDVLPELARPTVSVQAEAPELAAEDVEAQVAVPIETALAGLPGLQRLRSTSTPGLALVQAEFEWGADLYRQRQLVTERLEASRNRWPADVQPRLGPVSSLMGEIMLIAVRSPKQATDASALRDWADWVGRPALLAVPGVAQVLAIGGELRQYEIRPDAERMRLHGVRLNDITEAARGSGRDGGAGIVESSSGDEVVLRTTGGRFDFKTLRDLAVGWRDGAPIRLGQVAEVGEGYKLKRGDAGVDGEPAVILSVQKQPDVDTLTLTRRIEQRLRELQASLPGDAIATPVFEQADFIAASVGNVRDALLHAAIIATLVLLLFLASGRATLAAAVAIPLSLVSAVLALQALGLTIDTMSLGGLAIAVGELIDDAVVGVENVMRRLRENREASSPKPALRIIAQATSEVRTGILYATVIIVLTIAPVLALGGLAGRLFEPLALSYIVAILASLLMALTVTPALCLLGLGERLVTGEPRWLLRLRCVYERALVRVLDASRSLPALVALLLAIVSVVALMVLPRSFLPAFSERTLTVNLVLEPGIGLPDSQRVALTAERLMLEIPGVASVAHRTGRAEADEHAEGVHYSEFDVHLRDASIARDRTADAIRERLAALPGSVSIGQPITHRLDHVLSGVRAPLAIKLVGDDLPTLRSLASEFATRLADDERLTDVQIEKQNEISQWQAQVDSSRAGAYGLSAAQVQRTLARLVSGETLAQIVDGERRFDLVLRLGEAEREPSRLGEQLIDAPAGPVPLSWIADIERKPGPNQIMRENLRRRLVVSASAAGDLDAAEQALREAVERIALPPGNEARIEGEFAERRQSLQRLFVLGGLSLLLMAMVIHLRYRDVRLTLIVMSVVPLSAVGGLLALLITATPLTVASAVGFVTLSGIAARNALLKISHCLNLSIESGRAPDRALLLRAASERLVPVLMTASIAAAALAPLLVSADAPGKEILHPVAVVVFGGLLSATLLDSFLTPWLLERYALAAIERLRLQNQHKSVVPLADTGVDSRF